VTSGTQGRSGRPGDGRAAGSPEGESAARLADVCSRRATVYEVLATGLAEPTPALVAVLDGGGLVQALREAVAWLGPDAAAYDTALGLLERAARTDGTPLARPHDETAAGSAAAASDDRLVELRVEHARLFTGPGQSAVMCYASQYVDADERGPGRLNGAAAAYAAAAYRESGVGVVPERGELADHVTLELEFLFHLCRREDDAWAAGDDEAAEAAQRAMHRFLREHAARWLPAFAGAVRTATTFDLYRGLATLLSAHLSVELHEGGGRRVAGRTRTDGVTWIG